MHGDREGRFSSTSSQSMLTDEINTSTSTSIESACLPIGCSVSAKYRGAFCSAQVKTVERQVKLKVILLDTKDTITISEEQSVHPVPLRIGNTITIRLPLSNRHESRNGLAAIINSSNNHEEKQAIIKQIYDNSIYTVVFNDGDEKSLRRSSLCLQGIRLYQTKIGQQKLLDDIPTPSSTLPTDSNDMTSIVAVRRSGQHVFPALILKRKSLADYMWIKSFLDGREYIVHKRDDVQPYKNNSDIRSLCRLTSIQATKACEKFIKHNKVPIIWQKKKNKQSNTEHDDENNTNDSDTNTSESDVDDSDDETTEEKDSFVAQLFAFMDDRGTPINNIPKVHKYDLDLHRLFKIVRMLGGYNKVTKNDQWSKVYIKMGLPDESSSKNGRAIELAYKKYLFAYEDLSKKLGTMIAPSAYFGSRTSMSSDSRRSLVRIRQQTEEKSKLKQQSCKRPSVDSKPVLSSTKNPPISSRRKTTIAIKTKPSSSSESDTSDNETTISNKNKKQQSTSPKKLNSIVKKAPVPSDEKKKIIRTKNLPQHTYERSVSAPIKKTKSTNDIEDNMRPVIKIPKISFEILKESTLATHKLPKKQTSTKGSQLQDNTSTNNATSDQQQSKVHKSSSTLPLFTESIKQLQDLTPLPVTPVSPSPPPSITDESPTLPSFFVNTEGIDNSRNDPSKVKILETPSIFQSIMSSSSTTSRQTNESENLPSNSNKRPYSEFNCKVDEQSSPLKRSRSSQDAEDIISNRNTRLTYEDILVSDMLLVRCNLNRKKKLYARCIDKNKKKKELRVRYKGLDSKHDEWIEIDRVIKRQDEIDSNDEEIIVNISSSLTAVDENEQGNKVISNDQDNGIWKSLEIVSLADDDVVSCSSAIHTNESNNQGFNPMHLLPNSSTGLQQIISINKNDNIISINIDNAVESMDDNDNESINDDDHIHQTISQRRLSSVKIRSLQSINVEDILSTSNAIPHQLRIKEEIIDISSTTPQLAPTLIESITPLLPNIAVPSSPSDNRRASTRQQRRRTFRDSKDSVTSTKKRTRLDTDTNSNFNVESITNSEHIPVSIESQSVEIKKFRTVKRGGKRIVNQQDIEHEEIHSNAQINGTLRQQLEDMFKHRSSRYNFLDLNNNLSGVNRLTHLKDRMRQCQKVFFNLKSALAKIEKQRKIFTRRQKTIIAQPTTTELLLPSSCT